MLNTGNVILIRFPGAHETKVRPAVVLSSVGYNRQRPDVVLGAVTSQIATANTEYDYILVGWAEAGLDRPCAFRSYSATRPTREVLRRIGRLTAHDWRNVRNCMRRALTPLDEDPSAASLPR